MLRVSRISGIWNAEYESAKVRQDEMRFRERLEDERQFFLPRVFLLSVVPTSSGPCAL